MYDYIYADNAAVYLEQFVYRRFSSLTSGMSFDALNVINRVNEFFSVIDAEIKKRFRLIILYYFYRVYPEARISPAVEPLLETLLSGYDPVSGYVFKNEFERRRAILIEALISKGTADERVIKSASRALSLMVRTYVIRAADEAILFAYTGRGVTRVKWLSAPDARTCGVCAARNGKRYLLSELPSKPHMNCRCRIVPCSDRV